MKKKIIFGALIFVFGLLIAIGPFTIFHVCKPDQSEMYMKCYWTARAELGIGIVISILGLLSAISASAKTRIGLNSIKSRFGADLMIVSLGAGSDMENILIRGEPNYFYFDKEFANGIAQIQGVEKASSQFFLTSTSQNCCDIPVQFVGFDPNTDFTV